MEAILSYDSGSDENSNDSDKESNAATDLFSHLKPVDTTNAISKTIALNSTPVVVPTRDEGASKVLDPGTKEVKYNPRYDELYKPTVGPQNPYKTQQFSSTRNALAGYVEEAHVSNFQFENQRRTFHSYGYAIDPTVDSAAASEDKILGDQEACDQNKGYTAFENIKKREEDKRKRLRNDDPSDIEGFIGPWGKFVDEKTVMTPNEDEKAELDVILAKRAKTGKQTEEKTADEKTTLHIKDAYDYQGRSFLRIPQDVGVNLKSEFPPDKCFIPKKLIHTWAGHTKGVAQIRWFPNSAHLLLSASMDSKIKIWEVYNDRRCIRTYLGHKQAVRDITFNNDGTEFISCGYDRYCKLWDTETGECKSRFTSRKVAYCVKYHPEEDKQHLFVAGTSDKKIICWDTRSGEIVQEYDRHLGAVNSITFVDQNRRFVSTSDDKSLRVWEWDIPVDFKYIADPSMHSMPAVKLSPNGKWLACQSMDNKICVFNVLNRFKYIRKKVFTGHMVAGYACGLDFSPEMTYLISGDADGKLYIWDWKSTKLYSKFKAHDDVCIQAIWHPHETSKVATAGWDGVIKYWD
ncbi:pre-mRNA-processing factor 17 [Mactra antiquata]